MDEIEVYLQTNGFERKVTGSYSKNYVVFKKKPNGIWYAPEMGKRAGDYTVITSVKELKDFYFRKLEQLGIGE